MIYRQYLRAEYDERRHSFVSAEANWIDGEPSLEYRFSLLEDESDPPVWEGGLEKIWIDEDGSWYAEFFSFAEYADEAALDIDVEKILSEARETAIKENIDEFLAVIDIVKRRAVACSYEDETIEDLEGLFQDGPEDAYTLCDIGGDPRLHHHVVRDDECWYFHIGEIVDTEKKLLGWGLFAVHLPDLPSDVSKSAIEAANLARILLLDHLESEQDAKLAKRGFTHYMETERVDNPEYAYSNDTEVMAGAAINAEWNDETESVVWQELSGQALQDFLSGTTPYIYPREKWQPRDESLVDRFFKNLPQPTWFEDQLRAALDDQMGVEPDVDKDSPWNEIDLD